MTDAEYVGRELNRHAARANVAHEQLARVEQRVEQLVESWRAHAALARKRIERARDPLCEDTDTAADVACADAFESCADELARLVDGKDLDAAAAEGTPCRACDGSRLVIVDGLCAVCTGTKNGWW